MHYPHRRTRSRLVFTHRSAFAALHALLRRPATALIAHRRAHPAITATVHSRTARAPGGVSHMLLALHSFPFLRGNRAPCLRAFAKAVARFMASFRSALTLARRTVEGSSSCTSTMAASSLFRLADFFFATVLSIPRCKGFQDLDHFLKLPLLCGLWRHQAIEPDTLHTNLRRQPVARQAPLF